MTAPARADGHSHTHVHAHDRRSQHDPGLVTLAVGFGGLFFAPFAYGALGGPHIGGPVLCGMRALFGIPCPFCGLTTSFTFSARGRVADGFAAAPLGPLLWAACGVLAVVFARAALQHRTLAELRIQDRLPQRWYLWVAGALLIGWAYQILRVDVWHLFV